MDQFICASSVDNPRLTVVWTTQDAVDALAAGVCDFTHTFTSTAASAKSRAQNTRKHMQRFHEAAIVEYLSTRTLANNNRYFFAFVLKFVSAISCSHVIRAQAQRRNTSGEARVPLIFTTKTMIFYTFNAHALTTGSGSTRECEIGSCRFPLSYTSNFSKTVRVHYETGDDEHRTIMNAYLSKKVPIAGCALLTTITMSLTTITTSLTMNCVLSARRRPRCRRSTRTPSIICRRLAGA